MKELQIIQSKLKAHKGQTNAFGKYKYRSCEDILEAVKPLLAEQECYLIIEDEIVLIGDRYYVMARASITRSEGGKVSATAYAREPQEKKGMDLAQLTGATSSYARKYALNGLFCIDDTKDADSQKPPVEGPKMPKRSEVNKTLSQFDDIEKFKSYSINFQLEHGSGVWELSSGKQGNKNETWAQCFASHRDRINKVPPVDAKQTPDELQKQFNTMVDTCDSWSTYDFCADMMEKNPAIDNQRSIDALLDLEKDLTERLGQR